MSDKKKKNQTTTPPPNLKKLEEISNKLRQPTMDGISIANEGYSPKIHIPKKK